MDFINLLELEAIAKNNLGQMAFGYYVSGPEETTLLENREAFRRLQLH